MPSRSIDELLFDSEATLRLVDEALAELHDPDAEPAADAPSAEAPAGVPATTAALLAGLERVLALVDALERERADLPTPRTAAARNVLRDELAELRHRLRRTALSAREAEDTASFLLAAEQRLARLARPPAARPPPADPPPASG